MISTLPVIGVVRTSGVPPRGDYACSGSSQSGTSGRKVDPGSWLSARSSTAGGTCTTSSSASTSVASSSTTSGGWVSSVMSVSYPPGAPRTPRFTQLTRWETDRGGTKPGFAGRGNLAPWSGMKGVWALKTTARVLCALVAIGGAALLTGCSAASAGTWQATGTKPGQHAPDGPRITAPADGATGVPAAAEVVLAAADPKTAVTLTDASGTAVPGALRADRSSWVPAEPLKWGTAYTATVGTSGRKVTFTTMKRPGDTIRVSTPLEDGATYGVAMPLVVRFGTDIPKDQRAAVQ